VRQPDTTNWEYELVKIGEPESLLGLDALL
jgi:hypothetical protein